MNKLGFGLRLNALIVGVLLFTARWSGANPVYFAGTGHWYEAVLVTNGIVWDDANQAAVARGGYLCTITNQAEDDFAASLVDISYYSGVSQVGDILGPWLGAYHHTDGVWHWVTGEPFTYIDWYPGQPDGFGGSEQRLQFYNRSTTGSTWGDHPGVPISGYSLPRGYIVEYNNLPLKITQSSNVVTLTWPATNGWTLETTSALAGTNTVWTPVPANQYQTNLPSAYVPYTNTTGNAFFRIKQE